MAQALGVVGFKKVSCINAMSTPYSDIQFVSSRMLLDNPTNNFPPVTACSDISSELRDPELLLTARRTAITVCTSSPNDEEVPAVAVTGRRGRHLGSATGGLPGRLLDDPRGLIPPPRVGGGCGAGRELTTELSFDVKPGSSQNPGKGGGGRKGLWK
ncbi:hypothetical protein EVAR_100336_1 [Eumeta japonica]|uniref:Uncharacterized protein n=1 Tax=Eumeta variegata TaxID=151549 RepID=A0A4C1T754_EUMVA|nr:hypothetical protein EVAR_100336_1 [Eumeta japonica]